MIFTKGKDNKMQTIMSPLIMKCLGVACTILLSFTAVDAGVEEAKSEGALVLYGSMSAQEIGTITNAFEKKYPFIKVKTFRSNNEKILNRVLTEGMTGKHFVDVMLTDTVSGWALKQKDFLQPYKTKETEAFPEKFRDETGHFVCCTYVITNVIAYNVNAITKNEIPRTYNDLLNPKLKGKLGMEDSDAEWFSGLLSIWGKDRTTNYFRALMKQDPSLRRGHALLTQLTGAGEVPIAVNTYGFRVLEMRERGIPVDIVQADPVIAAPRYAILAKRAPHPNAGQLFIDYLLSSEGQQVIASGGRTVLRPGIKSKHNELISGVELHPVVPEMAKNHEEDFKLFYSLLK
jgi:iron(III) transport system substrate-binding protein